MLSMFVFAVVIFDIFTNILLFKFFYTVLYFNFFICCVNVLLCFVFACIYFIIVVAGSIQSYLIFLHFYIICLVFTKKKLEKNFFYKTCIYFYNNNAKNSKFMFQTRLKQKKVLILPRFSTTG